MSLDWFVDSDENGTEMKKKKKGKKRKLSPPVQNESSSLEKSKKPSEKIKAAKGKLTEMDSSLDVKIKKGKKKKNKKLKQ